MSAIIAGYMASQSQDAATQANLANYREQRDQELAQQIWNRGAFPNFRLPSNLGPDYERSLETDLQGLTAASRDIQGTPWEQNARYQNLLAQFNPAIAGSTQTINDIFNGNLTAQRQANLVPVSAARVAGAQTQSNSIMDSLQATKNQIAAMNQVKGFSGSNTFTNRNLLGATIGANGAAANAMSGAKLANAMDMRGIADLGINERLQNVNLPYVQGQNALAYSAMPFSMVQQNAQRALDPWKFFTVGNSNQQFTPPPMIGASTGLPQILATAGASAEQAAGSYLANRSLAQQYGQRNQQMNQGYSEMGYNSQGFIPQYNTGQYSSSQPAYPSDYNMGGY